jgi:hypothetical protein
MSARRHFRGSELCADLFAGGSRAAAERFGEGVLFGVKAGAGLPHSKMSARRHCEEFAWIEQEPN